MAGRRPVLCCAALALTLLWLLHIATAPATPGQEVFAVSGTPALRVQRQNSAFAGPQFEAGNSAIARQALPEPRPNDAMLPVDLNRTSLYWGLLCILILSVLFSSYFFN